MSVGRRDAGLPSGLPLKADMTRVQATFG